MALRFEDFIQKGLTSKFLTKGDLTDLGQGKCTSDENVERFFCIWDHLPPASCKRASQREGIGEGYRSQSHICPKMKTTPYCLTITKKHNAQSHHSQKRHHDKTYRNVLNIPAYFSLTSCPSLLSTSVLRSPSGSTSTPAPCSNRYIPEVNISPSLAPANNFGV